VVLVPRAEVVLLLLFLVLQDPLQIAAGWGSRTALYIKRADEFVILLVALGCLALPAVRRAFAEQRLLLGPVVCVAALLASTALAGTGWVPAAIDLVLFSKPLLMLAIGFSLAPADETLERLLPRVLGIMMAVLAAALPFLWRPDLQLHYLGGAARIGERVGLQVAQGFFINAGTYAFFAVATFCLAYAAWLTFSRGVYLLHACSSAAFVVLTWRRKSMLALVAVLVVSLLATRARGSKGRALLVSGLALVMVLTILAPYLSALTAKTIEEYGGDPYSTSRTALYYTSLRIARDHFPLGTGLASFGSHASRIVYSPVYRTYGLSGMYGLSPMSPYHIADTFWPMVLGQGGVVALVAYLGFLAVLGRATLRTVLAVPQDRWLRFLAMAGLLLLIGAFMESMASQLYSSSLQAALLFLPVGLYWRRGMDGA